MRSENPVRNYMSTSFEMRCVMMYLIMRSAAAIFFSKVLRQCQQASMAEDSPVQELFFHFEAIVVGYTEVL